MRSVASLQTKAVRVSIDDGIAFLELDRAPANALDLEALEEIAEAILAIRVDPEAKVAVVTSAVPRFFSAGLDLKELDSDPNRMSYLQYLLHELIIMRARTTPKIFIAAINGGCLGGGLELACACDIRVAGKGSWRIGHPEVTLGGFPGGGGLQLLVRLLGLAKAVRIGMGGETLSVDEAHNIGLLDEVVEQEKLLEHVTELAGKIAAGPLKSIAAIKMGTTLGSEMALPGALSLERELYSQVFQTDDIKEGAAAFKEKREPKYKGR